MGNKKHILIYIILVLILLFSFIYNNTNTKKLNKLLNEKDEKISSLTTKLSESNQGEEIKEESKSDKLNEEINKLKTKISDYETEEDKLNEELEKLQDSDVINKKMDTTSLNNQIINLTKNKKSLNTKINKLKKKLNKLENSFVVFYSYNDKILHEEIVEKGKNVKNIPNVPTNGDYHGEWDNNGKNIQEDIVIYPKYYYILTFASNTYDDEEMATLSTYTYKLYEGTYELYLDRGFITAGDKTIVTATLKDDFELASDFGWLIDDDAEKRYDESYEVYKDTKFTFDAYYACIAEGSKISMADGTTKNVEDIKPNDKVLSYDYYEGKISPTEVVTILEGENNARVFKVELENGNELQIVDLEFLFDTDSKKYIPIQIKTYKDAIGKNVMVNNNGDINYSKIKNITMEWKTLKHYTMYTKKSLNYIANNIVALAPTYYPNMRYKIGDDYKVDINQYNKDVLNYGTYTYEDFKDVCTKETFDNFVIKDMKFVVGKELVTFEKLKKSLKELQKEIDDSLKRFK